MHSGAFVMNFLLTFYFKGYIIYLTKEQMFEILRRIRMVRKVFDSAHGEGSPALT